MPTGPEIHTDLGGQIEHVGVYHLPTIASLPVERLVVADGIAVPSIASPTVVDDVVVNAVLVADVDLEVALLDQRTALGNVMLDSGLDATEDPVRVNQAIGRVRARRREIAVGGVFLVVRTTGTTGQVPRDGALAVRVTPSHTLVYEGTGGPLFKAFGDIARDAEIRLLGALRVAAAPQLTHRSLGGATYLLVGGRPEYRVWIHASGSGYMSVGIPADAVDGLATRVNAVLRLSGVTGELDALALSVQAGLEPSVEFVVVFTALEQYVKAHTPASEKPNGIAARFERLAVSRLAADRAPLAAAEFAALVKTRNALMHEGVLIRDQGPPGRVRVLLEELMRQAAGL